MTTIYWLLITDIKRRNVSRIPAVLFATEKERDEYLYIYCPFSYREFQYEIDDDLALIDLEDGAPLSYPNV